MISHIIGPSWQRQSKPIVSCCRASARLVSVCVCAFGVGGVAVPWLAWALWG